MSFVNLKLYDLEKSIIQCRSLNDWRGVVSGCLVAKTYYYAYISLAVTSVNFIDIVLSEYSLYDSIFV
jgi:hypothetical protein